MRRRTLFLGLAGALLLVGLGLGLLRGGAADLALTARIGGTCLAEDGAPRAQATLSFFPVAADGSRDAGPVRSGITGADGHFEVAGLQPGTWRLVGNSGVEVTLAPGEHRRLDLPTALGATVSGRVSFANGAPAPHAIVFVHVTTSGNTRHEPLLERADELGRFRCTRLLPGRIELLAALPGGGMTAPVALGLQAGEQRVMDLQFGAFTASGRVTFSEDGSPVPGARVCLLPLLELSGRGPAGATSSVEAAGELADFAVTSGADGTFRIGNLARCRYAVEVSLEGGRVEEQPPVVLGGADVTELSLRVTRTGSIRGAASDAAGRPVADGTTICADRSSQHLVTHVSGGHFDLPGLLPGSWRVAIVREGELLGAQLVNVPAGQPTPVALLDPR